MKNEIIKNTANDTGFKIIVGGLFLLFGILTIDIYFGYFLIIISITLFFYTSGIEFDFEHSQVRTFQKYFGFSTGNRVPLENYNAITVKPTRKGLKRYGAATNISIDTYKAYYDVLLLGKNNSEKILLFTSKNRTESEAFAELWGTKLGLPVKHFGTKI